MRPLLFGWLFSLIMGSWLKSNAFLSPLLHLNVGVERRVLNDQIHRFEFSIYSSREGLRSATLISRRDQVLASFFCQQLSAFLTSSFELKNGFELMDAH